MDVDSRFSTRFRAQQSHLTKGMNGAGDDSGGECELHVNIGWSMDECMY